MSFEVQKQLPPSAQVLADLPLSDILAQKVAQDRQDICNILEGKDARKLLIIGPCSAWPADAVLQYADCLAPVMHEVEDKLKIILRIYAQKPRTTVGWTGPMNQPNPFEASDIEQGIYYCREMTLKAIEKGFAIADEAVFTHNDGYFVDLLSWIAIGARSTEDQEHRIFASLIDHPVGMKNPTSGSVGIGVNSVVTAQHSHTCALHGQQIQTSGNRHAHLILRGGSGKSNASLAHLQKAARKLASAGVMNPAVVVDASHENSIDPETGKKNPQLQPQVLQGVLDSMAADLAVAAVVKGFMVESFLVDGNQSIREKTSAQKLEFGKSVTDGCLGWEYTETMIRALHARL